MRSIKYTLMACATAALFGCATYQDDLDAQGRPQAEYGGTYEGSYGRSEDGLVEGLDRGVNTNYFGPIDAGPGAAKGPGTPSGTFDVRP